MVGWCVVVDSLSQSLNFKDKKNRWQRVQAVFHLGKFYDLNIVKIDVCE